MNSTELFSCLNLAARNHVSFLVFTAAMTFCCTAKAEVEFVRVGDPTWMLSGGFVSAIPIKHAFEGSSFGDDFFTFMSNAFGDSHVADAALTRLFPGDHHAGPYDREYREAMAGAGGFESDVFLADDLRLPKRIMQGATVLALPGNDLGQSGSGVMEPVIPEDAFPIKWTVSERLDGSRLSLCDGCVASVDHLSDSRVIRDDEGIRRDYRGRNHSHFPTGWAVWRDPNLPSVELAGEYEGVVEWRDNLGDGWDAYYSFTVVSNRTSILGDLNYDEKLNIHDLEILTHNVALGSTADRIDLNGDVNVDFADLHFWVTDLKDTWIGDANLDGEFNSGDFVQVFSAGKYETDEFATWSEGDWNADERFDSGDFVAAFANGGYEQGPRVAAAVPEPSGRLLAFLVLGALPFVRARLS